VKLICGVGGLRLGDFWGWILGGGFGVLGFDLPECGWGDVDCLSYLVCLCLCFVLCGFVCWVTFRSESSAKNRLYKTKRER